MCKDTYVPHKFLLQMFITGLMYTIVTIIKHKKDKKGCREHVTPIPYSSRSN